MFLTARSSAQKEYSCESLWDMIVKQGETSLDQCAINDRRRNYVSKSYYLFMYGHNCTLI